MLNTQKEAIPHFYWTSNKTLSLPTFAPSFEPQNRKEFFGHSHKKTGSNQIRKCFYSINGIDISFNRWRSMIIISYIIRKKETTEIWNRRKQIPTCNDWNCLRVDDLISNQISSDFGFSFSGSRLNLLQIFKKGLFARNQQNSTKYLFCNRAPKRVLIFFTPQLFVWSQIVWTWYFVCF